MPLPEQGESAAGVEEVDTGILKQGSELLKEEEEVSRRTSREGQGLGWNEVGGWYQLGGRNTCIGHRGGGVTDRSGHGGHRWAGQESHQVLQDLLYFAELH